MLSYVFFFKWLEQYPEQFKSVCYSRYVDDIFVLVRSRDLIKFRDYLKKCYLTHSLTDITSSYNK